MMDRELIKNLIIGLLISLIIILIAFTFMFSLVYDKYSTERNCLNKEIEFLNWLGSYKINRYRYVDATHYNCCSEITTLNDECYYEKKEICEGFTK